MFFYYINNYEHIYSQIDDPKIQEIQDRVKLIYRLS